MRFSVRVAPGIRVSASSRGVRTSVGPRAARVHVGGGRTGVSSGAGPVSFYTSLGTSSRTTGRSNTGAVRAASPTSTAKLDEAQTLSAALEAIRTLHQQTFAPAARPIAPRPDVPSLAELRRLTKSFAVRGISVFHRSDRARAREWADGQAQAEFGRLSADALAEQAGAQVELDRQWAALLANDPMSVIRALAVAFADNTARAAPIGVDGDAVSLVLLVPDESAVPDRTTSVTAAGNLSVRQATKTQVNATYWGLVSGHVIVTAKEAFAVAPAIQECSIVVVRLTSAIGLSDLECICATRIGRGALAATSVSHAASEVLAEVGRDTLVRWKGVAKTVTALDLADQPEVLAVLAAVDVEGLARSGMRAGG